MSKDPTKDDYVPPTRDEVLAALTVEAHDATDPATAFFIAIRAAHYIRSDVHRPDSFYAGARGARKVIEQISGVSLNARPVPKPDSRAQGRRDVLDVLEGNDLVLKLAEIAERRSGKKVDVSALDDDVRDALRDVLAQFR